MTMRHLLVPLLACVGIGSGPALAQPIRFAAPHELGAGAYPIAVASGDFNGDGKRDLAVANQYSNNVTIMLGLGDGRLQRIVNYGLGTYPVRLAVADFNGDGRDDVVAAAAAAATLGVLLTNPNGTCQPAINVPTAEYPFALAAADYDGDGRTDVAALMRNSNAVWLLRGRGDGTFHAPSTIAVGTFPFDLAAADFDADGKIDLVASSVGGEGLAYLAGNGDGTFQRRDVPAPPVTLDLTAGDLNRDAIPDLLVTDWHTYPSDRFLTTVRLGNGDGTFVDGAKFTHDRLPTLGDFNDDGVVDLAMGVEDDARIHIRLGLGDGTFGSPLETVIGGVALSIVAEDFNQDGRLDLAVGHQGNNVSVRLGNGDGTFLQAAVSPLSRDLVDIPREEGTAAPDFNEDGYSDLAIGGAYKDTVLILLNDAHGTFLPPTVFQPGDHVLSLGTADFDGDGHVDVTFPLMQRGVLRTLLGNGDGTFRSGPESMVPEFSQIGAVADFNADGHADLVMLVFVSTRQQVLFFLGNGDGSFRQTGSLAEFRGDPQGVAVADLNSDGKLDVAVSALGGPQTVTVALGNGDGSFGGSHVIDFIPAGDYPMGLAAGRLDGDAHVDLVFADATHHRVGILFGNGDGTFQPVVHEYAGGLGAPTPHLLDLNGDSNLDIVLLDTNSNCISSLAGDGTGHFALPAVSAGIGEVDIYDAWHGALTFGRFNSDARPDAAAVTDSGVWLLFNTTQIAAPAAAGEK